MEQVTFTITKEEILQHSNEVLSDSQLNQILEIIENDMILWKDIEEAINSAIEVV